MTGVQTCALPISLRAAAAAAPRMHGEHTAGWAPSTGRAVDPEQVQRFGAYAPFVGTETGRPAYTGNVQPFPQRGSEAYPPAGNDGSNARAPEREPQLTGRPPYVPQPAYADAFAAANSNTQPSQPGPVADVLPFTPPAAARPGSGNNPQGSLAAVAVVAPAIHTGPVSALVEQAPILAPVSNEPEPRDWQREIGVVMTRVTESITVPVSEASLPNALAGLMRRATVTDVQVDPVAVAVEPEPVKLIASPQAETDAGYGYDRTVKIGRAHV